MKILTQLQAKLFKQLHKTVTKQVLAEVFDCTPAQIDEICDSLNLERKRIFGGKRQYEDWQYIFVYRNYSFMEIGAISKHVNLNENIVGSIATNVGLKKISLRRNTIWNDADEAFLLKHYKKGMRAKDIARALHRTKDAVTSHYATIKSSKS